MIVDFCRYLLCFTEVSFYRVIALLERQLCVLPCSEITLEPLLIVDVGGNVNVRFPWSSLPITVVKPKLSQSESCM